VLRACFIGEREGRLIAGLIVEFKDRASFTPDFA
jgi:hypothetical protein